MAVAPAILDAALDGGDLTHGLGTLAKEFQYLRAEFAPYKIRFLGDISTDDGTCMLLPRNLRGCADKNLPRVFTWLRKHATKGRPPYAWHDCISVSHIDPDELPNQLDRLTHSEATKFFHPETQIHTEETDMPVPPTLQLQFIRRDGWWWVISDGSGLHRSFAACVARGPIWLGKAGRVHGPANSFLAELWGLITALRLVPHDQPAVFLVDCLGALFRAADGLPRHASQRLRLACGEALNALQIELDARAHTPTEWRWYPGHVDKKIPLKDLPPLGRAQVWCDEACRQVTDLVEIDDEAFPGEMDEAFSLWSVPTEHSQQRRVPTNKLRSFLYKAIASARADSTTTRPRPDIPSWKDPKISGTQATPLWRQKMVQGKTNRPLRRTYLLARQGLFITPPLYDSLVGPPEEAFEVAKPCPQCHGDTAFPAHVFFDCPAFAALRSAFEADVIRYTAPLIAPAWSTVRDVSQQWEALLARFQEIREVTKSLPDHSKPPPPPEEPKQYDPRTPRSWPTA